MTIQSAPCRFCDQFYDQMAQQCTGVYRGDRLCYCPYGCGRLYNKAYMYYLRDFFPHCEEDPTININTRNRHSIPPPLKSGTPLPSHLGRHSENGLISSKSWRYSLPKPFYPNMSHKQYYELDNHPPANQYFGIQSRKNGDMTSSHQFPSSSVCSTGSDDSELNMEAFSFDRLTAGSINHGTPTTRYKDQLPIQYRLHPESVVIERNNTFGPSSCNDPPSTETNRTSSSTMAPIHDDAPTKASPKDNDPLTATVSDDAMLLLKEMRSMRQLLQDESKALLKMSKYYKKQLMVLDECTKRYVDEVEYIQQLKYDMEKLEQEMEDQYLRSHDIQKRQNQLINQYFRDKEKNKSRRLKNWCKRIFSLGH